MSFGHPQVRRTANACVFLLCALAFASCGSPSSPVSRARSTSGEVRQTLAAVQGLPLAQRDAKLLALARKQGGKLLLYTTLNAATLAPLVKKFEAKYGIQVSPLTTDPASLVARVTQESQAGHRSVDVIETGGPELNELAAAGALANFTSPLQIGLGAGAVQPGWTTTRYAQFVVGWNTRRLKRNQWPTSWEQFANPTWKGRISISPDTQGVSVYKALSDYWKATKGWTQAHIDKVFAQIVRNARVVAQSLTNTQLLASGEIDAAIGSVSSNNIDTLRAKGAPVAWRPVVEPVVRQRQGEALVRDAPHPAAALLFLDYELSDGQRVFAADFRDPARLSLDPARTYKSIVVDLAALASQQAALNRRWAQIIASGSK